MRGHAEFADYFDFVRDGFPDFHNAIEELFGEDDRAAACLTYRGTHRSELFGISATGRKIEYAGTAFFRFRANRICEIWVLGDVRGLVQRLSSATGLEPSEPLGQPSAASLLETVSLRPTTPDDLNFVLEAERDPDSAPNIVPWARS